MSAIKVSVIIPTYNRKALLAEMLACLGRQTYPLEQVEVIVVIDGSLDGTREMLQGLDVPFLLRPVYQEQAGVSVARNHGARLAQGQMLVFLDDDLLPEPQLLQEHVDFHRRDPRAVVLGRFLPAKTDRGAEKKGWHLWEEQVLANHYRAMGEGRRPPAGRRLYSGNFSVGRDAFWEVGGFDEQLRRGEDVALGFRLEQSGLHFYFNPQAAAVHRGYRSFESWRNSAYLYGRTDIQLSTDKGFSVLPEVFRWYHRQPWLARWMLDICLGRNGLRSAAVQGLKAGSGVFTRWGLLPLAHLGYSSIYRLQYWQGVADQLGSKRQFRRCVKTWRPSSLQKGTAGNTAR